MRTVAAEVDVGERRLIVQTAPTVLHANRPQVERIVELLLKNAVQHTPPGTSVWLSTSREGSFTILEVADSGPGIPAPLREQVLRPFEQGATIRDESPGLGIGLSLVARFAELHGGRVDLDDRPGGGARFRVRLWTQPRT